VYMVFDDTKSALDEAFYEANKDRIVVIDESLCKGMNPLHESNWASADATLAILYQTLGDEEYTHLWLIESDVYCDGNWAACLSKAQGKKHDFLATCVEDYSDNNADWIHWSKTGLEVLDKRTK
jgi:hypothetical protein